MIEPERQIVFMVVHVNSSMVMGRAYDYWIRSTAFSGGAVYRDRESAEAAAQALRQEARDRISKKETHAEQMWRDLAGGLIVVREVELIAQFAPEQLSDVSR